MVIGLLVGYFIGRAGRKTPSCPEEENDMASSSTQDWSSYGQDTRSFQELLQEAREHRANKDNQ
jgi:hypothetical protein